MKTRTGTIDGAGVEQQISDLAARQARTRKGAWLTFVVALAIMAIAAYLQATLSSPIPEVTDLSLPASVKDALNPDDLVRGSFAASQEAISRFSASAFKALAYLCLIMGVIISFFNRTVMPIVAGIMMICAAQAISIVQDHSNPPPQITLECMKDKTCVQLYRSVVKTDGVADHFLRAQIAAASGDKKATEYHLRSLQQAGAIPALRQEHAPAVAAIVIAAGQQLDSDEARVVSATKKTYDHKIIGRNVAAAFGGIAALIAAALSGLSLAMSVSIRRARSPIGPFRANKTNDPEPMEMDLDVVKTVDLINARLEGDGSESGLIAPVVLSPHLEAQNRPSMTATSLRGIDL